MMHHEEAAVWNILLTGAWTSGLCCGYWFLVGIYESLSKRFFNKQ